MTKDGQHTKRSSSQTDKRLTRAYCSTVFEQSTNARLSNNNEDPQKLWRLLRTKHHLPTARHARKERLRQQRMEHENRKTKKNLQTHNQRTNNSKLHRKLVEPAVPENRNKQYTSDERRSSINATFPKENKLHGNNGKITCSLPLFCYRPLPLLIN